MKWVDLLAKIDEHNIPAPIPNGWMTAKDFSKQSGRKMAVNTARHKLNLAVKLGLVEKKRWKITKWHVGEIFRLK